MIFDWDKKKNQQNIEKHGADFEDVKELFEGDLLVIPDIRKDYNENRFVGYGYSNGRLMCVVYTERLPDVIRVISLRKANNREKRSYEERIKNKLG